MKRTEFNKWLERHGDTFPGLLKWMESNGGKKIADRWFDVLKLTDYESACQATDRMLGDTDSVNSNYTSHPAKIKQISSGASVYRSREFSEGCICKGTGMVEVLNDGRFNFKTADGNRINADTVTVLCKCELGAWYLNHQGGPRQGGGEHSQMAQFREGMHVWGESYPEYDSPPISEAVSGDPFASDLPAYQPNLYTPRGVEE